MRIVCGKGNDGGDGLVAARHLAQSGHDVEVVLLWPAGVLSGDAAANLERFEGSVRELSDGEAESALRGSGAVVDAIFGTGFEGSPRDPAAAAVAASTAAAPRLSPPTSPPGVDTSTGEVEDGGRRGRP